MMIQKKIGGKLRKIDKNDTLALDAAETKERGMQYGDYKALAYCEEKQTAEFAFAKATFKRKQEQKRRAKKSVNIWKGVKDARTASI